MGIAVNIDQPSRDLIRVGDFAHATAQVVIDLASLQTGSDARDTNVKEAFFEVRTYFNATLAVHGLYQPTVGGVYTGKLTLTLRGVTKQLPDATFRLVPVEGGYRVQTVQPISIVNADFAMPVAALLARCNHSGVDPTAEVTADVFLPVD